MAFLKEIVHPNMYFCHVITDLQQSHYVGASTSSDGNTEQKSSD